MTFAAAVHVVVDQLPSQDKGFLDYLPAITACIAAISAGLSGLAVWQARKIWQGSLLPVLSPTVEIKAGSLMVHVANVSKTLAPEAGWAVLWGDRTSEGRLHAVGPDASPEVSGYLKVRVGTDDKEGAPKPVAIAWCRDRDGNFLVWTSDGRHSELKPTAVKGKKPADLLAIVLEEDVSEATDGTPATERVGAL